MSASETRSAGHVRGRQGLAVTVGWRSLCIVAQGQADASVKIDAPVPHAPLEEQAALVFASLARGLGLGIKRSCVGCLLAPYGENGDEDGDDGAHPAQDGSKSANQVGAHRALLTELVDALLHPRACCS
jgi:hypothetical protein